METGTLLMAEGGLWHMPFSQGRGAYQVHLGDDYGGGGEDEDDCGLVLVTDRHNPCLYHPPRRHSL